MKLMSPPGGAPFNPTGIISCYIPNLNALRHINFEFLRVPYKPLYKTDQPPGRATFNPRGIV